MSDLVGNPEDRFSHNEAVITLPFLLLGPLLAIGVIAVYWDKLGKPLLSGIAILMVLVLVQALLSRLFSRFR